MEQFILIFHFLVAIALIALVLIQQGKGAEAGASFGAGASQTVFGSGGGWNFFSKSTAVLATIFFVTSVSLAVIAKNKTVMDDFSIPELESVPSELPLESELPGMSSDSELPGLDSDSELPGLDSSDEAAAATESEIPQ
ncbi:preprotein translocase subunit SecG [Porticoccaceae bacterium]|jgi:preprotein translocase subunit SecG|nr:preprotein translocase subunit SecG [Porticoccaceae bacterium]MDA8682506.1 preprotein translocase subunit SecG [Porticoccaceae bacterium]MDB2343462.1 preprotein translocase subunit SecG [Porticoccaceae bacterium]MDB2634539.1 preprotein translocase subunit SecG [Porticoccaceae bacterium]MDB2664012.1 preprotein translocase subunit SecG [Porticoccaceae bacterium]